MRIITKDRDYYDCVQRSGQDLTCVWVRDIEAATLNPWPFVKCSSTVYGRRDELNIEHFVIGFCGKIHHVLKVRKGRLSSDKPVICYSFEELDQYVHNNYNPKQIEGYKSERYWKANGDVGAKQHSLRKFFNKAKQEVDSHVSMFENNGCPIFIATDNEYIPREASTIFYHGRRKDKRSNVGDPQVISSTDYRNSTLNDLEFYRLFPTQQAFQETWQYISGVLGMNNPDVPVPDDVTMRDIKGFDKYSFKKSPSKKRR